MLLGRRSDGKIIFFKNTKRVVKVANSGQGTAENFPIEVPGLPSMAITFSSNDQRLLFSKNNNPYAVLKLENENVSFETPSGSAHERIFYSPEFRLGQKTLHYVLETYKGFYDTDNIVGRCLDAQNYQAAAKTSFLDGHYGDSLGFQLTSFKEFLESSNVTFAKENTTNIFVKSAQEDLNEKNLTYNGSGKSSAKIMSPSLSLDSIRQWGDDIEHQGGCESPCDFEDVQKNVTQYVQSLKDDNNSPPVSSVSSLLEITEDKVECKKKTTEVRVDILDYNFVSLVQFV